MLQASWEDWTEEAETQTIFISATDSTITVEVDDVEYIIKAGSDDMDQPWIMEIIDVNQMDELKETWLNDVNEEFQGKERSESPKVFFQIVQECYDRHFGWGGEEDEDAEDQQTDEDNIFLVKIGAKLDYQKLP